MSEHERQGIDGMTFDVPSVFLEHDAERVEELRYLIEEMYGHPDCEELEGELHELTGVTITQLVTLTADQVRHWFVGGSE